MKQFLALAVTAVFLAGSASFAGAQTSTPAPAPAEKKADKPVEKKMPVKSARGTVKSATADNVVVAGKEKNKEVEWTFAVDHKTTIKRGSKSITAGDLKTGDAVHVRYMDANGKVVAEAITVRGGGMVKKEEKK